jgi:hypothetical protein
MFASARDRLVTSRHPTRLAEAALPVLGVAIGMLLIAGPFLATGRSGFKSPLPDYAPPIDSLKLIKVDWQHMTTKDLQRVRSEWTGVFNP